MSIDLVQSFAESVTTISATAQYPVGVKRFEAGKEYVYQQASATVTAGQAVKLDYSGSSTGKLVTPTTAAANHVFGVAEIAVTSDYYFWATVSGIASTLIVDGTTAGDPLIATTEAGALGTDPLTPAAAANRCAIAMETNGTGSPAALKVFLFGIGA